MTNERYNEMINEVQQKDMQATDKINPSYYKNKPIEIFDCIASIVQGKEPDEAVCIHNIIKCVARYNEKNGVEDLDKAKWYLNKLISLITEENK